MSNIDQKSTSYLAIAIRGTPGDLKRRIYEHVVYIRTAEDAENPFIKIHDGHIETTLRVHDLVAVDACDQVVTVLSCLLQNSDMTRVEHVPRTCVLHENGGNRWQVDAGTPTNALCKVYREASC